MSWLAGSVSSNYRGTEAGPIIGTPLILSQALKWLSFIIIKYCTERSGSVGKVFD